MKVLTDRIYNHLKSGEKLIEVSDFLKKYDIFDWEKYVKINKNNYNREKIYSCNLFDIYIITWDIGQKSLIHDHSDNGCLLKVLQGKLSENVYNPKLNLIKTNICDDKNNNISYMDNNIGLHNIENIGDEIVVTFHIYSPPNHQTKYF